jgi:hypothetical protein
LVASEFDRKWVSTAFYRHEIESELRETPGLIDTLFNSYNSFDAILPQLEASRISRSYPHGELTPRCRKYKCQFFDIFDGIWSINHAHCAAPVTVLVCVCILLSIFRNFVLEFN